ncbi:aquaporin-like protein [Pyrenochaeta sp. MPI-SDFR-AT-0127]|nr:aquaporin-like protein [Pyrenochaeta sp. MPI-SDFR-AT-0127]
MPTRNILPLHRKETSQTSESKHHLRTDSQPNSTTPSSSSRAIIWQNEFIAAAAEFIGTFMFLFFAFSGTQVAHTATSDAPIAGQSPDTSVLLYISLSFGFSLMVNVWVFFRVSGGLFNPAVTLGLCLIGATTPVRAGLYFIAQMLAGMSAAAVVEAILPGPLMVSTDLSVSIARGIFIEMFLTSLLVFTIFMLAAEKHKATYLAPIGIGLALFVAHLVGVRYTGAGLNPARSFGPCVATLNFPGYQYVYWVGPLMGTLLAIGTYKIVKLVEYEVINPGQDGDGSMVCSTFSFLVLIPFIN